MRIYGGEYEGSGNVILRKGGVVVDLPVRPGTTIAPGLIWINLYDEYRLVRSAGEMSHERGLMDSCDLPWAPVSTMKFPLTAMHSILESS